MELQIDAETLDGMTIREWRQEAIDRRKELIAHLEGKVVNIPKPYKKEFKVGDRVKINRAEFKNDDPHIPDSQNGVSWNLAMLQYDGHIGKIKSIHRATPHNATPTYEIEGASRWHWIAAWLDPVG